MEDIEIIELYFKREEDAISATDYKYGSMCRCIAMKLLDDKRDVEECLSDTYVALWNQIPPTRPSSLKAYISKLIRNLSIKKFEYNTALKRNHNLEVNINDFENVLIDNKNEMKDKEIAKMISNFLRVQSVNNRNIFIRKYYYFDSIEEISIRFNFNESKVKSILFRMRKKLKNI